MNLAVNFRLIFHMCGWVALFLAGAMLIPVIPALILDDGAWTAFLKSAGVVAGLAALGIAQGHRVRHAEMRNRDGLALVGIAWLSLGLLGALPYWFSGALTTFGDG